VANNRTRPAQAHEAIAALQRLTDLFRLRRAQLARAALLSEQQWQVLEEIASAQFMPSMFARGREQSPAAVSRVIRQLLDRKLIAPAVARGSDRRHRTYALTALGRRTLDELRGHRGRAIEAIWLHLDPRELSTFTKVSGELAARLDAYARHEG
jgi:DNA-binding MarR family transcriptional regulator